jgi:hypothetical protein
MRRREMGRMPVLDAGGGMIGMTTDEDLAHGTPSAEALGARLT